MKSNILIIMITVAIMFVAGGASAQFYYGGGDSISLSIDSTKIMIKFDSQLQQETIMPSIDRIVAVVTDDHAVGGFIACSLSTGSNYDDFLDSVQAIEGIYLTEPFYVNSIDSAFLVGLAFCVAFDTVLSSAQIDSINVANGTVIDHEIDGMPNVYVLENTDSSGYRMLDLANHYYEMEETRYSHPEFGVWIQKHSYTIYDYYSSSQPHTKKVIGSFNNASVWDFAGLTEAVTVAVLDDGIDAHEDLPSSRVLSGYDFADDDSDPTPGDTSAHGMGCAGIIASSHTTNSDSSGMAVTGVFSMAPKTLVLPVKIFNDEGSGVGVTSSDIADAITYARDNGAEIISNSWGYFYPSTSYDVINDAIERASLFGRNGRGCPVIFSSGNNANSFPGQVGYPANQPGAFSVGATELDDDRWYYSQYGSGLDMVAPSGNVNLWGDVWTMDQMSSLGWNPTKFSDCPPSSNDQDYDCHFGGTSAAAPVVSGTAALLLSFDSTLSAQAVYYILRNSAVTDLESGTITPPDTAFGYGRVDAFRAILSLARGDMNSDGKINLADLTILSGYIYQGGAGGFPDVRLGNCDCDSEGKINLADINLLIDHIYISKDPLPLPCFVY